MKKRILFQLVFISVIILLGCTKNFEDINTNPNAPGTVIPSALLRQVIYNFGNEMSYEGFVAGDLLAQHRTAIDFNLFDRHDLKSPQLGGNPWPIFYTNLRDNEILLKLARQNTAYKVYEGPALILKSYMSAGLTDLFGNVPYFDAFKGTEGIVKPTYDFQKDIYLSEGGILDNLEKAIIAINSYQSAAPLEGDILYNGNLKSWIRFANSLKIKYLLRISNKVSVSSQLQKLYDDQNFIINPTENAVFNFSNSAPNSFRMAQLRIGDFNNFVLSKTMENVLKSLNDNRITTFFRPYANSNFTAFNGLQNGINAAQTSIALSDYSLAGNLFRENTGNLQANFSTSWETNFLLAEAAEKGLITANSENLYNLGVRQAFTYWNTQIPANYLVEKANFNATHTTPLAQIGTQKWIASVTQGYEAWIEYRRTGFPELPKIAASLNNDKIPNRMPYPAEAATLNSANYSTAEKATNGNSINIKVWWDE